MKKEEIKKYREKTIEEIKKEVEKLRFEISKEYISQHNNENKNTNIIREKRKKIAVLLTLIRERELSNLKK